MNNYQKYDKIEPDELKKMTNRAIAKLLESLADTVPFLIKKEIKHHFRWYENNVRELINNGKGQSHEQIRQ